MTYIRVSALQQSSIFYIYTERDRIQLDPPYQRPGGVWGRDKKQLLIDSIINVYDIPKLYFHEFLQPLTANGHVYDFAIIDGRQRLETIWGFIDGEFALSDDFEYLRDPTVQAAGLTYAELAKRYPRIKHAFDGFSLPIMAVQTDDLELIEDMFSRLNEAVPLNAAEKRNAFGGPMPPIIRRLSRHTFFQSRVPFGQGRYRYLDLAAKFLYIRSSRRIPNTKKIDLDEFVRSFRNKKSGPQQAREIEIQTETVLGVMADKFTDKDPLLQAIGMVLLYFHLFRLAVDEGQVHQVDRADLMAFEQMRANNRKAVMTNIRRADRDLIEFEEHAQTPNDAYAIRIRLRILMKKLKLNFGRSYLDRE